MASIIRPSAQSTESTAECSGEVNFDEWAEQLAKTRVCHDPELATRTQYLAGEEQDRLDRRLTPISQIVRSAELARARTAMLKLRQFDLEILTPQQRASARSISASLTSIIERAPYTDYEYVFNHHDGLHIQIISFLTQIHPLRDTKDIEHYLQRLKAIPGKLEQGMQQSRAATSRGIGMPRCLFRAAIAQLDFLVDRVPSSNVLVTTLVQRCHRIQNLMPAQRARYVNQTISIVKNGVIPAFRRVRALLKQQFSQSSDVSGLWQLPDGAKAYAAQLGQMCASAETPQQIHAFALQETIRIEALMHPILVSLGYDKGSASLRMGQLEYDLQPRHIDPRTLLLDKYEGMVRDASTRTQQLLGCATEVPVVVQRVAALIEQTACAHYTAPSWDGTQPGVCWIPMPGQLFAISGMRSRIHHYIFPGLHFQKTLQHQDAHLPHFSRTGVFEDGSTFGAAWSLYAEQLAVEHDWYSEDPVGLLGQLASELQRARSMVVDTGLHGLQWTRQQAIDFGLSPTEIDRCIAKPALACASKLGMMQIMEWRKSASRQLGDKFTTQKFHHILLQAGDAPLSAHADLIEEWIAKELAC